MPLRKQGANKSSSARSLHDLNDREIGFKSLAEVIDTTSSGGRLAFHIFEALADFAYSLIRERTIAGLEAARARGRKGGRKHSMSQSDIRKAAAMLSPNKEVSSSTF